MNLQKVTKKNLSTQVKEILLKQITDEDFGKNQQLPNEILLADSLGVSRITIRDALKSLEQDGYITRTAGRGTYANYEATRIKSRISNSYAFHELLKSNGYVPSSKVIAMEKEKVPADIINKLKTKDNDLIYIRKVLFFADGVPAVYCENYIDGDLMDDSILESGLTEDNSFLNTLKNTYHFPDTAYDIATILPAVMDKELATLFNKKENEPCLFIESTIYGLNHRPMIYSKEYYNNDIIQFSEIRVNNFFKS